MAVAVLTPVTRAHEPGERPPPKEARTTVPWTTLRFEASKLFWTATTTLRWVPVEAGELPGQLIDAPSHRPLAARGRVVRLELASQFAGRQDDASVWVEESGFRALQRLKRRRGKKAYQKTYRFTEGGVYSHRLSPRDGEPEDGPPNRWSRLATTFYPYSETPCAVVSEPTALFFLVSVLPLEPGERHSLCTFSNKDLQWIEVEAVERTRLEVDLELDHADGTSSRIDGPLTVRRLVVRPRDTATGDDFELLGLEGELSLWVADQPRLPVRLSGRLGALGRTTVDLRRAELAAP